MSTVAAAAAVLQIRGNGVKIIMLESSEYSGRKNGKFIKDKKVCAHFPFYLMCAHSLIWKYAANLCTGIYNFITKFNDAQIVVIEELESFYDCVFFFFILNVKENFK